jgi:DNA processing protein
MTLRDLVALSLVPTDPRRISTAVSASAAIPEHERFEALVEWLTAALDGPPATELRSRADRALDRAAQLGMSVVGRFAPGYPEPLAATPDPPPVLWALGSMDAAAGRIVAIVGSRAASAYGLGVAERLAAGMAKAGVAVVSGMARGCDAAAHTGALDAGGKTIAVLGSGADIVYPAEHRGLHRRILENGGLVLSEWPPGTPPRPYHFPLRNRIISGLSRATVVVEASHKSGSLITAACALEQGRDVMAVPGPVVGERHRGSHGLLRDGARLVASAEDILEELGWAERRQAKPDRSGGADPLLAWLPDGEDCDVDTLAARSGSAVADLLSRLMELELAGAVRRLPGGRFTRAARY